MNNLTMTIKVEAPDLVAALTRLAASISSDPSILTPDTHRPQVPTPAMGPAPSTPQMPDPATTMAAPVTALMPSPVPVATAPLAGQTLAPGNPTPQTAAPAPTMPVAGAPTYTLDQISKAGAALVDAGKMEPLLALLTKYGVQAITQLQPAQYGVFATELRALGAQI